MCESFRIRLDDSHFRGLKETINDQLFILYRTVYIRRFLLVFRQEPEKVVKMDDRTFEFYKLLFGSIQHDESRRESINQVWLVINSFGLTALNLFKETNLPMLHKEWILFLLISFLGIIVCVAWVISLISIKQTLSLKYELLSKLEDKISLPILSDKKKTNFIRLKENLLQFSEMSVPLIFLVCYSFLAAYSLLAG